MTYDSDDPIWVKLNVAAYYAWAKHGVALQPQTIRKWAERNRIRRSGECYSIRDLDAYLDERQEDGRVISGLKRRGETRRRKADVAD